MVASITESSAPVSLYLQLEEGKTADLEVVARSALAFATAVRELVFDLDPTAEVRVELVSGTEGSLSLNSVIRTIKENKKKIAVMAALTVLSWFGQHHFDDFYGELHGDGIELSDDERRELARAIADEMARESTPPPAALEVYRELSKDPVIEGVGASLRPQKPRAIVPRDEFPASEGDAFALAPPEDGKRRRSRPRRITVVLISPVLLRGARRWKLRSFEGEFGAVMGDEQFLEDVLQGNRSLPSVEGVLLDVDLDTVDEWNGVVWKTVGHRVQKVHKVIPPATQGELDFGKHRPKRNTKNPNAKKK